MERAQKVQGGDLTSLRIVPRSIRPRVLTTRPAGAGLEARRERSRRGWIQPRRSQGTQKRTKGAKRSRDGTRRSKRRGFADQVQKAETRPCHLPFRFFLRLAPKYRTANIMTTLAASFPVFAQSISAITRPALSPRSRYPPSHHPGWSSQAYLTSRPSRIQCRMINRRVPGRRPRRPSHRHKPELRTAIGIA
jgi:hypothetical protein